MKPRAGCGAGAGDVPGVLWDLRFDQNDVQRLHAASGPAKGPDRTVWADQFYFYFIIYH